jgi:hypothetical protein
MTADTYYLFSVLRFAYIAWETNISSAIQHHRQADILIGCETGKYAENIITQLVTRHIHIDVRRETSKQFRATFHLLQLGVTPMHILHDLRGKHKNSARTDTSVDAIVACIWWILDLDFGFWIDGAFPRYPGYGGQNA